LVNAPDPERVALAAIVPFCSEYAAAESVPFCTVPSVSVSVPETNDRFPRSKFAAVPLTVRAFEPDTAFTVVNPRVPAATTIAPVKLELLAPRDKVVPAVSLVSVPEPFSDALKEPELKLKALELIVPL
jgi:hypothetical protein